VSPCNLGMGIFPELEVQLSSVTEICTRLFNLTGLAFTEVVTDGVWAYIEVNPAIVRINTKTNLFEYTILITTVFLSSFSRPFLFASAI